MPNTRIGPAQTAVIWLDVALETDAPVPMRLTHAGCCGTSAHRTALNPINGQLWGTQRVPDHNPTRLTLDQYVGNHVVQSLGDGNYALYAHLATGTVKVKPDDLLSPGQVIGGVGNTGNSSAPHLHVHVMTTPDPLRSDGLPFVVDDFRLEDRIAGVEDLDDLLDGGPVRMQPDFPARDQTAVMPLELDMMTYADQ